MKDRLVVMNGQRLLQSENSGKWATKEVANAEGLKPGVYQLHNAKPADKNSISAGPILHTDSKSVFQLNGKSVISHDSSCFDKMPKPCTNQTIKYSQDNKAEAKLTDLNSISQSKSRTR